MTRYFLLLILPVRLFAGEAEERLLLFNGNYPVAFYFRETESIGLTTKYSHDSWASHYSTLYGVMGKMLDEERVGISVNQPYLRRFNKEHPEQAVLLHANGCFRKPEADLSAYYDGH